MPLGLKFPIKIALHTKKTTISAELVTISTTPGAFPLVPCTVCFGQRTFKLMPVCGSQRMSCLQKGTSISTLDGPDRMTHLGGFILVISHPLLFQISCNLWVQGLEKHLSKPSGM